MLRAPEEQGRQVGRSAAHDVNRSFLRADRQVGQYCEIPDNVVYTVEYSIHAAALAVASLLGAPGMVPPAYQGLDHPHALVGAIRRVLE